MKICIINEFYEPYVLGGVETYLSNLTKELVHKGNEVIVITTNPVSDKLIIEETNKIKIYRIKTDNIYSLTDSKYKSILEKTIWNIKRQNSRKSYERVKEILALEKPQVVHTNNLYSLSMKIFDAVKELKIPLIHELHDYNLLCMRTTLYKGNNERCIHPNILCSNINKYKKKVIKHNPDLIIGPSNFVIEKHRDCGFFTKVPSEKLSHGVIITNNIPPKKYDTIDLLYVGTLADYKGINLLLEAFLESNNEKLVLHISGKGKYSDKIRELSEKEPKIKYYGYTSNEKLNELYNLVNIVVVPSLWYEVFGLVILEAFSHHSPVIASAVGGISEIVSNSHNGYLFPVGDRKKLTNILNKINIRDLRYMEDNIKKEIQKYEFNNRVNKLYEIYMRVKG